VAKGALLSAPVGILSPLHFPYFSTSSASKTYIFSCSELSIVHILPNSYWCVHLFKTTPVVLFYVYVA